jgi:hypothetical protein
MNKLVEEAPYHPGYEDAVIPPKSPYKGFDPDKMIWKQKPLSDEEINALYLEYSTSKWDWQIDFARAIEEAHGIK